MMTVVAKYPIRIGKKIIPKGTRGEVWALSNSAKIREAFPEIKHKPEGFFYIVKFPEVGECLCDKSQLDFL